MTAPAPAVHRIEVRAKPDRPDPRGDAALRAAGAAGLDAIPSRVETSAVYLIEGDLGPDAVQRIADELLADPVTEAAHVGTTPPRADALIEVHPLPGVMDPDGEAIELAIHALLGVDATVHTAMRYDLHDISDADAQPLAARCYANTVVHAIHAAPFHPESLPHGEPRVVPMPVVPIRDLDDDALVLMSREAHLFLSLDEMRAIRDEYVELGRDPREIELETLAQTWSEHCVHKTLKATIRYQPGAGESLDFYRDRPGHDVDDDAGTVTIHNLLKCTVAAATHELIADGLDWCLSVFVDNAGIIAFDDDYAVCFKAETHNHPSAIEPYGGAATGIGGCIRDIMGTGLAAKPIAATDIFCVATPDGWSRTPTGAERQLPDGCLHPRRILTQVAAGVRDYGNRMGIPTLNGTVWFDDNYVGNPLVFCGCIGVMPRDRTHGDPLPGDHIIALGGRTGRDGIHGATFSSAELTDTHADEFSHAVQIGNAVTEKKALDAILEARDHADGCLFRAITDCGAGGFSSAVGEMGETLGATVHLDRAPLKYAGLTATEIWISEAQERMVLAVPTENVEQLAAICAVHDVEWCDLGTFGTPGADLILHHRGEEVGRLPMAFLHDGLPEVTRDATWHGTPSVTETRPAAPTIGDALLGLLGHANIASKHWIIRQYDHEVQGGSVIKPFVGVADDGPSDAAVVRPVADSDRGLAIGNGLATGWRDDPYRMTLAAIDECVRNMVCVGADPARIAILDNFCWPSCGLAENLGDLVRAAEGCYDGAKAYRTPFISGKDSLNNQFTTEDGTTIRIPPTLLISGFGIVPDVQQCVTMDAKTAGNLLILVGVTEPEMGGSHYGMCFDLGDGDPDLPHPDLDLGPRLAMTVHGLINAGLVRSAHDASEGGVLLAASEMAFAGGLGLDLDGAAMTNEGELDLVAACFAETPSRYLLEIAAADLDVVQERLADLPFATIGRFEANGRVVLPEASLDIAIDTLKQAWQAPLDW